MKLKYIGTPVDLGGTAVSGCGTIHQTEIKATLTKLSGDLGLSFDLNEYTLGSTGKREYSGDIDLVISDEWCGHSPDDFRKNLEQIFGKENVAKNGNMIHLKYPIVMYKEELQLAKPRTGFVQVDFMFGDVKWKQFYHYSDSGSAYKGAHRNLMLAAITSELNTYVPSDSYHSHDHNQPLPIIRWKWGPNGLIQVFRRSVKDKHGHWKKKQEDIVLAGPYTDPEIIADILLPQSNPASVFDSMETIMIAVKKNYSIAECEKVWKRSASNFYNWSQGNLFEYPSEIAAYLPLNDK